MNKDLNAQAFAHGSDVYFGAGKSPGKNELTAHELTHPIQQTGGLQQKKIDRVMQLDIVNLVARKSVSQFKDLKFTKVVTSNSVDFIQRDANDQPSDAEIHHQVRQRAHFLILARVDRSSLFHRQILSQS